jgi:hypothetical protein
MEISSTEKTVLSSIQQYVIHLRYLLAQHQVDQIDPPAWFLNELKTAERLLHIELREREKFRQQFEI